MSVYSAFQKVLVLEAVAPVITTRGLLCSGTQRGLKAQRWEGLIFVLENQRHFIKKGNISIGFGKMYRSFPEEDGEDRRNFRQKDGACAKACYLIFMQGCGVSRKMGEIQRISIWYDSTGLERLVQR